MLQVGDWVKVLSANGFHANKFGWVPEMNCYVGHIYQIEEDPSKDKDVEVEEDKEGPLYFKLGGAYWFHRDWLEHMPNYTPEQEKPAHEFKEGDWVQVTRKPKKGLFYEWIPAMNPILGGIFKITEVHNESGAKAYSLEHNSDGLHYYEARWLTHLPDYTPPTLVSKIHNEGKEPELKAGKWSLAPASELKREAKLGDWIRVTGFTDEVPFNNRCPVGSVYQVRRSIHDKDNGPITIGPEGFGHNLSRFTYQIVEAPEVTQTPEEKKVAKIETKRKAKIGDWVRITWIHSSWKESDHGLSVSSVVQVRENCYCPNKPVVGKEGYGLELCDSVLKYEIVDAPKKEDTPLIVACPNDGDWVFIKEVATERNGNKECVGRTLKVKVTTWATPPYQFTVWFNDREWYLCDLLWLPALPPEASTEKNSKELAHVLTKMTELQNEIERMVMKKAGA